MILQNKGDRGDFYGIGRSLSDEAHELDIFLCTFVIQQNV